MCFHYSISDLFQEQSCGKTLIKMYKFLISNAFDFNYVTLQVLLQASKFEPVWFCQANNI